MLHQIGCLGKITSLKETNDGRYLVDLKGIVRFQITKEIKTEKKYRECETNYESYLQDLSEEKEDLKLSKKLDLIINIENVKQVMKIIFKI